MAAVLRIGLSTSANDATSGSKTFNLATITAVSDHGTLLFAVPGLAGLSFAAWRRRSKTF
jgi:hypothetical protein